MAKPTQSKKAADENLTETEYLSQFLANSGYEADDDSEDLSQYEEERVGTFPPYWKPALGKGFVGRVVELDARDPEFLRYVIESSGPLDCMNGPVDGATAIKVQRGELFTVGVYRAMPLHQYMGLEDPIVVVCTGTRAVKGRPNDMWTFKIQTSKRDHAAIAERKAMQGNGKQLDEKAMHAFELAHTAKNSKEAVKAALR